MKPRIQNRDARRGRAATPFLQAGLLLLLPLACGTPGVGPTSTVRGREGSPELKELDGERSLNKDLEIVRYRSERRDGRLHVQFDLQNKRDSNLAFEWSMEWFDSAGFRIETGDHWTPVVLGGKGFETIAMTAPTTEASIFKLAYRRSDTES